jgi:alpha-D-ribose 1-methylphosphonate 5-triphosphate diphosphatase
MSGTAFLPTDTVPGIEAAPESVLCRGRLVTEREVLEGNLLVAGGRILAVLPGGSAVPRGIDLEEDYLLPGLVETHTDNLERHLVPRPAVVWPSTLGALLAHDAQLVAAGITTVLDAVAVGAFYSEVRRDLLHRSVDTLRQAIAQRLLRAEHWLHLRLEVSDAAVLEMFQRHVGEPLVRLISFMDHTPGQRQWSDLEKFRTFHQSKNWSEAQFRQIVADRIRMQQECLTRLKPTILEICRGLPVALASHDDTTPEDVTQARRDGVSISEFPTTLEAAQAARAAGLAIVGGAPNLVRGGSHSGNLSMGELAAHGLLDVLSSDYAPTSLLHAAFLLHQRHGHTLPQAVSTVTATPAWLIGFQDRGRLAEGLRADLVRVGFVGDLPIVKAVWREGVRIF